MATTKKVFLGNIKGPQGEQGNAGPQGPAYTLTDVDKNSIADAVVNKLTPDTWVFTMEDGSTITRKVLVG